MSVCKVCNKVGHETQTQAVAHAISLQKITKSKLCKARTYYDKRCKKWHVGRGKFDRMNEIFERLKTGEIDG